MASSYEELIQAKKDAVGLQLESEYRSRLQNAYTQVKYFLKDNVSTLCLVLLWEYYIAIVITVSKISKLHVEKIGSRIIKKNPSPQSRDT